MKYKLTSKTLFIYESANLIYVIHFSSIQNLDYDQSNQKLTIARESYGNYNFTLECENCTQEIFDDIVKHLEKHL